MFSLTRGGVSEIEMLPPEKQNAILDTYLFSHDLFNGYHRQGFIQCSQVFDLKQL
jgi:hypothetical protein